MVFGNLAILFVGGALLALPIVLHLLMKQKPRVLAFPALRFLQETQVSNQRRLNLKHWLLLALRVLLIGWLTLALAQPSVAAQLANQWAWGGAILFAALVCGGVAIAFAFQSAKRLAAILAGGGVLLGLVAVVVLGRVWGKSQGTTLVAGNQPVAAVFLVQTSPSMDLQQANQTRLERAVELAERLVGELPLDSRVSVAGTDETSMYFAVDVAAAQDQLKRLTTHDLQRAFPQQIRQAVQLLDESGLESRELYVLTDRTTNAWPEGPWLEPLREELSQANVALYLVDVRAEEISNLWLDRLRLASDTIARQGTLEVSVAVNRLDTLNPAVLKRTILLRLEQPDLSRPVRRDGQTVLPDTYWTREDSVELGSESTETVSFKLTDLPAGVHHGWVEIQGQDALSFDDRRYFTIEVRPAWRSLVLVGEGVDASILTEAIAPSGEREAGRELFQFEVRPQDELSREPLESFDSVYLLDPDPLTPAAWELLGEYVQGGGGLALFLGAHAVGGDGGPGVQLIDPSFRSESARAILPADLTEVWRVPEPGVSLSPADLSHPLLKPFRGRETSVPWSRFPVHRHWGTESLGDEVSGASRVILRLSNGMPAVLERSVGRGRVVLWSTPITEVASPAGRSRWNDLTLGNCWPYFLLINELADELVAQRESQLNYQVGQAAVLPYDADTQPDTLAFFPPRDEDPQRIRPVDHDWVIRFTETPGAYRMKGEFDGPVLLGFSVNVADAASDLSEVGLSQFEEWFDGVAFQTATEATEIERQQGEVRRGQSFYALLMALLPVWFVIEYLLSTRFYVSRPAVAIRRGA